jgi:hypothetical protein
MQNIYVDESTNGSYEYPIVAINKRWASWQLLVGGDGQEGRTDRDLSGRRQQRNWRWWGMQTPSPRLTGCVVAALFLAKLSEEIAKTECGPATSLPRRSDNTCWTARGSGCHITRPPASFCIPVEVHEHSQISTNVLLPKCRKKE